MQKRNLGSVYRQTYNAYLRQLKDLRFEGKEDVLGITMEGGTVVVPFFGQSIRLDARGLTDEAGQRPDFSDCVVVCRYLIMCPLFEPKPGGWTAYRDFPDAGPLTVFWSDNIEKALSRSYSGDVDGLENACDVLGGIDPNLQIACDLCCCFRPLPKVPLLLVFNDADDDFPAATSVLFEKRAATYLDAESQAILGHALTQRLIAADDC